MSVATLMNSTADIQSETATKDAAGFTTRAWNTTTSAMPCRVRTMSGQEIIAYGRLGLAVSDMFYFATDPGISGNEQKRRIVWNGNNYNVKNVNNAGGQIGKLWQVLCDRDKT